jgi:hypothetical protein
MGEFIAETGDESLAWESFEKKLSAYSFLKYLVQENDIHVDLPGLKTFLSYSETDTEKSGSFSDLIKVGDTDRVFDFFTNIEPTLVGGKDFSSPINSEGSFFSLGFGKAACIVVPWKPDLSFPCTTLA